jgi:hypothetical protein
MCTPFGGSPGNVTPAQMADLLLDRIAGDAQMPCPPIERPVQNLTVMEPLPADALACRNPSIAELV